MNTHSFHVMAMLLACGACAPAAPASAQAPLYPAALPGTPAMPQPASGRGNIVGRIATNPWHAVKDGAKEVGHAVKGAFKGGAGTRSGVRGGGRRHGGGGHRGGGRRHKR